MLCSSLSLLAAGLLTIGVGTCDSGRIAPWAPRRTGSSTRSNCCQRCIGPQEGRAVSLCLAASDVMAAHRCDACMHVETFHIWRHGFTGTEIGKTSDLSNPDAPPPQRSCSAVAPTHAAQLPPHQAPLKSESAERLLSHRLAFPDA
jgi:hypothetical protein